MVPKADPSSKASVITSSFFKGKLIHYIKLYNIYCTYQPKNTLDHEIPGEIVLGPRKAVFQYYLDEGDRATLFLLFGRLVIIKLFFLN